jgi:NDP-sugar pyrophosphorylase family protein
MGEEMSNFEANADLSSTPFAAVILAAGVGSRLAPLTHLHPKPLVPLALSTPLADLVAKLTLARRTAPAGVLWSPQPFVLNAFHLAEQCAAFAELNGLAVSREAELLGTAGGVRAAARQLASAPLLVWNADILAELNPNELCGAFAAAPCFAHLAVVPAAVGQGNVGVDAHSRIVRLRTQQFSPEISGGYFMGIQVLSIHALSLLPVRGCLVTDLYLPALRAGAELRAWTSDVPFVDLGTLMMYWRANLGAVARAGHSLIADSADIGAGVAESVVGAHARVLAPIAQCVVFPGSVVNEPMVDAIITPAGILRAPFTHAAFTPVA